MILWALILAAFTTQSLHEFRIIEKMRMLIITAFLAVIAYNYMNYVPGYSYFVTGILFVHMKIIVLSVNNSQRKEKTWITSWLTFISCKDDFNKTFEYIQCAVELWEWLCFRFEKLGFYKIKSKFRARNWYLKRKTRHFFIEFF